MRYSLEWKDRQGFERSVTVESENVPPSIAKRHLRLAAAKQGWAGHSGGRWNYFKSDVKMWLMLKLLKFRIAGRSMSR